MSPFRCNPLGARDKPDGSIRLILDLFQPEGQSVNAHIDPLEFTVQYTSVDEAIAHIFPLGPQSVLLAKADLQHAFRLIPVLPTQRWLLGFQWNDLYYYDVRIPFGLRSACAIFTDLADMLTLTTRYHARHLNVHHYLDDFFFIGAASTTDCARAYDTFLAICTDSQVPLSPNKCCPPTTRMELLGCVIDTVQMTISLPHSKLQAIIAMLQTVNSSRTVRQRDLLSLVGKLVHATKCIPAGRSFFRRLLDTAYSVRRPHHWVTLTRDTKRDLDWWLTVLPSWNGTAPLIHPTWTPPADLQLHTDASGIGFGGCCGPAWFSVRWPAATTDWADSVSWLEMMAILTACLLWGHQWSGLRILMHCDNAGVVGAWKKGWSRDPRLMSLLRQALLMAARHSFGLRVTHVAGVDNAAADALSRLQVPRFRGLRPAADVSATPIPPELTAFLHAPTTECTVVTGYPI